MIKQWIGGAIATTAAAAAIVSSNEAEGALRAVEARFARAGSGPLWERFAAGVAKRATDGWWLAPMFLRERPIVLFVFEGEHLWMWRFEEGEHVARVLGECPGLEFYLCDESLSSLMCHTDHDVLCGVGSCERWLAGLGDDSQ